MRRTVKTMEYKRAEIAFPQSVIGGETIECRIPPTGESAQSCEAVFRAVGMTDVLACVPAVRIENAWKFAVSTSGWAPANNLVYWEIWERLSDGYTTLRERVIFCLIKKLESSGKVSDVCASTFNTMLDLGLQEFKKFSLPEEIAGEKIVAHRRMHAHDDELFTLIERSREHLRKFLFWIDDTKSIEDVRVVTDIFAENWESQKSFEYVFFAKASGKMVGAGGVHTISHMNRTAEFGYYLDKDSCGNGYATEFVRLLEKALFANGIHRCVIECDADNVASAAVAERLGYTLEGRLRDVKCAYGGYRDGLIFSKLENE